MALMRRITGDERRLIQAGGSPCLLMDGGVVIAGWRLPAGLPPGRYVVPDPRFAAGEPVTWPVLWISDQPVQDGGRWWAKLLAEHRYTRLWPLLLEELKGLEGLEGVEEKQGRPWHSGELSPVRLPPAGERDADRVLAKLWERATATSPDDFDWGDVAPLPFAAWPGLAPAATGAEDPDAHAATFARRLAVGRAEFVGLVMASSGGDAVAACGWLGASNHATSDEAAIVIGSWEQRFGVRLVAAGSHTLDLAVAAPPGTVADARRVAAEHYAFSPDNFGGDVAGFDGYASKLVGLRHWKFWWD